MMEMVIGTFMEMCLAIALYEEIKFLYRSLQDGRTRNECSVLEEAEFRQGNNKAMSSLLDDLNPEAYAELERLFRERFEQTEV